MLVFQINHKIKPDKVEIYKAATLENARNTVREPGNLRFEVYQDPGDETRFMLFEIYKDEEAQQAHFGTAHFAAWRGAVADVFDGDGQMSAYEVLFPAPADW